MFLAHGPPARARESHALQRSPHKEPASLAASCAQRSGAKPLRRAAGRRPKAHPLRAMATPYRLCLLNLIRVTVRPELLWEDERQADGLRPGWADERLLLLLALLAEVQSSGGLYEPTFGQLCARMRAANWRMGEAVTSVRSSFLAHPCFSRATPTAPRPLAGRRD